MRFAVAVDTATFIAAVETVLELSDELIVFAPATPDVAPAVLGPSFALIETIHEQAPATGDARTPAAVDAVRAGIEVAP
jgi:hypothetical protein